MPCTAGKPEPGAAEGTLGGEEGLEDVRLELLGIPVPVSLTASMTYSPG